MLSVEENPSVIVVRWHSQSQTQVKQRLLDLEMREKRDQGEIEKKRERSRWEGEREL